MNGTGQRPENQQGGNTHSSMAGWVREVVQARDVSGGVHFHADNQSSLPIPAQLPADARVFVNRLADLERMDAMLGSAMDEEGLASVCVIAGTAGVGKTSLAVHWAYKARARFPDGQLYVDLRGYDPGEPITSAQALERFLEALGVLAAAIPTELESRAALYRTLLADKRMLVVLDNAATVGQVRPLLPGAGRCVVLITSRNRLSGLVARDGAHRLTLDVFDEPAAVELLHTTTTGYRVDDADDRVAELARLCARLPLALRIAAERAAARPHVPLSVLIDDLREESSLWDALSSDDDEEADAVRTVFAWSYRALPAEAARMFRLLGLHPGPDFSTAVAAALAALPINQVRQLLDALVGAHLLEQIGPDRWKFHDLLRAYATDQTHHHDTIDDRHSCLRRALAWYLYSADAAVLVLSESKVLGRVPLDQPSDDVRPLEFLDHAAAAGWFQDERFNLLAAAQVASKAEFGRIGWQLPAVLSRLYVVRNLFDDWYATSLVGLEVARRHDDLAGQSLLHVSLGMACRQSHRLTEAIEYYSKALKIYQNASDRRGEALTLSNIGIVRMEGHHLASAREYFERSLNLCRQNDLEDLIGTPMGNLGWAYLELDQPLRAVEFLRLALAYAREIGNRGGEFNALMLLATANLELGERERAVKELATAVAFARSFGNLVWEGHGLIYFGAAQQANGQLDDALVSYQQAAVIQRRLGDRGREAVALDATGTVYRDLGRPEDAVGFHRQAIAVFRELGDQWRTGVALDHLATVLWINGDADEVRSCWREADSLLMTFDDPKANSLRNSVKVALAEAER